MWQELARHGVQHWGDVRAVAQRKTELEGALDQLCQVIAAEAGASHKLAIERARALRSKPATGGKSPYECLNQLVHYWYCCRAAEFLLHAGYQGLQARPTAHDNVRAKTEAERGRPFDIEAIHPSRGSLVAEVFCVSEALWTQKMLETRARLQSSSAACRAVFYNLEAKPAYQPKMENVAVFGIDRRGAVSLLCSTYPAQSWPSCSD